MRFKTRPTSTGATFEFASNAKIPPRAAVIQLDSRTGEEILFSKAGGFTNAGKTANRYASAHAKAVVTPFLRFSVVAVEPA